MGGAACSAQMRGQGKAYGLFPQRRHRLDSGFALRLREVAAWVSPRIPAADVGSALRSPELRPPGFPPFVWKPNAGTPSLITDLLESPSRPSAAVDHIVERRREALARSGVKLPDVAWALGQGRILCTDFNSDVCGVATLESNGFLDWEDVPAWDTWFDHRDTGEFGCVVACWIPRDLVELVQRGIDVIPVTCLWWDDDPPSRTPRLFL
jgi:hypothetical protein